MLKKRRAKAEMKLLLMSLAKWSTILCLGQTASFRLCVHKIEQDEWNAENDDSTNSDISLDFCIFVYILVTFLRNNSTFLHVCYERNDHTLTRICHSSEASTSSLPLHTHIYLHLCLQCIISLSKIKIEERNTLHISQKLHTRLAQSARTE